MLCDAGCTEPLVDVIPTGGFTVVADPATARLAKRVKRLECRTGKLAGRAAEARADGQAALGAARKARSEVWQLKTRVSAPAKASSTPRAAYAGWLIAAPLAAALALLVLRGRPLSACPRPRARGPPLSDGDEARRRPDHHGELRDSALRVRPQQVDALQRAVYDPRLEQQPVDSIALELVGVAEVLEHSVDRPKDRPDGLTTLVRLEHRRAPKDHVLVE